MAFDIGQFDTIKPYHGTVKVGGNVLLQAEGKGTVRLNCLLPDGSLNLILLKDVLYVPTLCHNLFSWNKVPFQGFKWEASTDDGYLYTENRRLVLATQFHNNHLYIILAPKPPPQVSIIH